MTSNLFTRDAHNRVWIGVHVGPKRYRWHLANLDDIERICGDFEMRLRVSESWRCPGSIQLLEPHKGRPPQLEWADRLRRNSDPGDGGRYSNL